MKNNWKRFSVIENILMVFFSINILLNSINNYLFNKAIPVEIVHYLFWLSLGLFIGFKLCKYEIRLINKRTQINKENE